MDGSTRAVTIREDQRRRRCDLDLLVIACGFECLAPPQQDVIYLSRFFYGCMENRLANCMQFGIRRVEEDDTPIRKKAREQLRESAAECLTRAIRFLDSIDNRRIA